MSNNIIDVVHEHKTIVCCNGCSIHDCYTLGHFHAGTLCVCLVNEGVRVRTPKRLGE